ncbi:phage resistance protein [Rhodococcus sp. 06-1477-1B]|nr:BREX-2 system phosphatase PglZ [Rhodococcus sp. 06-1474-1B]OZD41664.1 phage resistance protein [Rhodococcus sp. 06-1477-1B]OZD54960.1 phage resistance protein [Rhodococcus sp. 06-1474-1B]
MTASATLPKADLASVRNLISNSRHSRHNRGVIAVSAAPEWAGDPEFTLDGQTVKVRTAPSVLAIRDALTERSRVDWVVILTDRTAAELPVGILEHLAAGRLSNLDPWPVLREMFSASKQEFNLLSLKNESARAVLRELDGQQMVPAPGGVLTNEHLFTSLARDRFGLQPAEFTPHSIAMWSMNREDALRFDGWRARTDPQLFDEFLSWISGRLGPLGSPFTTVLRTTGPTELVPLGLVAALLDNGTAISTAFPAALETSIKVRTLLEVHLGGTAGLTEQQLIAWGNTAALAVSGTEVPADILRRGEDLVTSLQADSLIARSDVLPSAMTPRIGQFASALAESTQSGSLATVENAWANVISHRSARMDTSDAPRDVRVGSAALRLLRWLQRPAAQPSTLASWLTEHRLDLSWVDGAVNAAFTGADNTALASAAHHIVDLVRQRRSTADRQFASLLAANGAHRSTSAEMPLLIEDLLDRVVRPLTVPQPGATGSSNPVKPSPVLLIVADGMSTTVANETVADALRRYRPQWQECVLEDSNDLQAALAVLPTVTKFSRCSLLTGALATGTQDRERSGFASWLQSNALPATGQVLFHKADMDAVSRGHALAFDVRIALEDTGNRPVIACVLNDIDDALDRSDPIGSSWSTSSFKHLDALLAAAAAVGRTVVLTSDHGHVVERREQPSVQRGVRESARYRSAIGVDPTSLPADEILVEGERVRTDDHRAILAVDEQVRYTGLKAGYHGGATLSEAVIPVSILVNGAIPPHLGLVLRPNPVPVWWDPQRTTTMAPTVATEPVRAAPKRKPAVKPAPQPDSLFDVAEPAAPSTTPTPAGGRDLVAELLASPLFTQQYNAFPPRITKPVIGLFIQGLIDGNGRLPLAQAAEILGVQAGRAKRTIAALSQVINADGVVALSENGIEVELAAGLMFEQYEVKP